MHYKCVHVWVFNLDRRFVRRQAAGAENLAWIILCSQLGSGKQWLSDSTGSEEQKIEAMMDKKVRQLD
jgi:hypothetical protein